MTNLKFQKRMAIIGKFARVLLTGLKYMITGTLTLGLFAITAGCFWLVSKDSGYVAVFDFIASCFMLVVSVASLYFLGLPGKSRGGKYVE